MNKQKRAQEEESRERDEEEREKKLSRPKLLFKNYYFSKPPFLKVFI